MDLRCQKNCRAIDPMPKASNFQSAAPHGARADVTFLELANTSGSAGIRFPNFLSMFEEMK